MTGPTRKCAQRGNSVRPAPGPERPPGGIATLSGESAAVRPENGANTTFSGESAVYDASFVVIMTPPRPIVTSPRDALWKMRQRQAISRPENDALTRKRRWSARRTWMKRWGRVRDREPVNVLLLVVRYPSDQGRDRFMQ